MQRPKNSKTGALLNFNIGTLDDTIYCYISIISIKKPKDSYMMISKFLHEK